jgi:NAD-dependent dihydropyrimidine dehydrogenase PreA subunit
MVYLAGTSTLSIAQELCTGCGVCLEVCPRNVLELTDRKAVIVELDRCIECGACQLNCRYDAISVEAGVGCASALINGMKTGGEPVCGCGSESGSSCC